ncbi:hypothetical protein JCM5296_001646 [Sporobolomyces johnsonii]
MPPPKLDYATSTYLTLSTASPSTVLAAAQQQPSSPSSSQFSIHSTSSTTSSSSSSSDSLLHSLSYVGPVGALAHEHLYALPGVPSANPPAREVVDVKEWLARQHGVRSVEVLVPKQRTGRRFEC